MSKNQYCPGCSAKDEKIMRLRSQISAIRLQTVDEVDVGEPLTREQMVTTIRSLCDEATGWGPL